MNVILKKDGQWYIAEIENKKNLYAFWYTPEEAIQELKNVIDMMVEYYQEEIETQKKIQKHLSSKTFAYAV